MNDKNGISACIVVYNEDKVISKCLDSIRQLVDEIIVVHDGNCNDETINIAKKYTDKIFIRDHVGMMEGHLVFAYNQTNYNWILRIDADEYFDETDTLKIRELINDDNISAVAFKWEMWNGQKAIYFDGLQKRILFRKSNYSFCGIPHEGGVVRGEIRKVDIMLHHRPVASNISWANFLKKKKKWAPIHAKYFFPETVVIDCYQSDTSAWVKRIEKAKKCILWSIIFYPFKYSLGQLKNGLWKSFAGINSALQQYSYYLALYIEVYRLSKLHTKNNILKNK
ncbi:MAG: glycosyltransferase [bacterium]